MTLASQSWCGDCLSGRTTSNWSETRFLTYGLIGCYWILGYRDRGSWSRVWPVLIWVGILLCGCRRCKARISVNGATLVFRVETKSTAPIATSPLCKRRTSPGTLHFPSKGCQMTVWWIPVTWSSTGWQMVARGRGWAGSINQLELLCACCAGTLGSNLGEIGSGFTQADVAVVFKV